MVLHRLSWTKTEKPGCQSGPQTRITQTDYALRIPVLIVLSFQAEFGFAALENPSGSNSAATVSRTNVEGIPERCYNQKRSARFRHRTCCIHPAYNRREVNNPRGAQSGFRNVAR